MATNVPVVKPAGRTHPTTQSKATLCHAANCAFTKTAHTINEYRL